MTFVKIGVSMNRILNYTSLAQCLSKGGPSQNASPTA